MKHLMFILIAFFSIVANAQKPIELKKKYYGTYSGEISTYKLDTGKDLVDIEKSPLEITIAKDSVFFIIGRNKVNATYKVLFEAQKYFVLDCVVPGRLAGERIVIYKKGKKISRDGLYPQPGAMLHKE